MSIRFFIVACVMPVVLYGMKTERVIRNRQLINQIRGYSSNYLDSVERTHEIVQNDIKTRPIYMKRELHTLRELKLMQKIAEYGDIELDEQDDGLHIACIHEVSMKESVEHILAQSIFMKKENIPYQRFADPFEQLNYDMDELGGAVRYHTEHNRVMPVQGSQKDCVDSQLSALLLEGQQTQDPDC